MNLDDSRLYRFLGFCVALVIIASVLAHESTLTIATLMIAIGVLSIAAEIHDHGR